MNFSSLHFNQFEKVTGGGNELAKYIVHKLASLGCNVAIVGKNLMEIEKLAAEVKCKDVKVNAYHANTCDNKEVFALFDKVSAEFSNVDFLVSF